MNFNIFFFLFSKMPIFNKFYGIYGCFNGLYLFIEINLWDSPKCFFKS